MPSLRNGSVLEVFRGIKAFFNVEVGLTRGEIPTLEASRNGSAPAPGHPASLTPASPAGQTPLFFVVGQPKSGTSWLMNLLNAHPEILCRGEGKLFGSDSPRSLYGALSRSKELGVWLERNPWTWREEDPDLEEIVGALSRYLMVEKLEKIRGNRVGKDKWLVGDKSPFITTQEVAEIARILPGSKVIHIIRDGRDVGVSTVHHLWNNASDLGEKNKNIPISDEEAATRDAFRVDPSAFGAEKRSIFSPGQATHLASQWSERVGATVRDGRELLGGDYLQVFYEDMLEDPAGNAKKALEFLGASADGALVEKCVEAVSFEKKANRNPGEEDPTSFYRKGVSGDWKGVMTREDREAYKASAGDLLVELGYEKDGDW